MSVPPNMTYATTIDSAIVAKRELVKLHPTVTGSFSPSGNNKIIFHLPNNKGSLVDLNKSLLAFDLVLGSNGGSLGGSPPETQYKRMEMSSDWIRRLTIRVGNQTVVDVNHYNLIKNILRIATSAEDFTSNSGTAFLGTGSDAQRTKLYSASRRYAIPLLAGIGASEMIPCGFLNQNVEITLYLADTKDICEVHKDTTSATLGDYSISTCEYLVEQVTPSEAYAQSLSNLIATAGIQMHFTTYEHHQNVLTAGVTNSSVQVPTRNRSTKGIISVMRRQSLLSDLATNNKLSQFNYNSCSNIQYKVNSVLIPQQKINCSGSGVEAYLEFSKYFQHLSSHTGISLSDHSAITGFSYTGQNDESNSATTPEFIQAYDFSNFSGAISGKNLTSASSSLVIDLEFGSGLSQTQQIDMFIEYDAILVLGTAKTELLK